MKITKVSSAAQVPSRANPTDAGQDLFYCGENTAIFPGERKLLTTGLKMQIPEGYVGLIWPRSGLAVKNGIDTLAGVIDSSYRGVVQVVLINHSDRAIEIEKGQRIAQILIQPISLESFEEVSSEEFDSLVSTRGEGGFGSTGT